jgi:hypothetical protein
LGLRQDASLLDGHARARLLIDPFAIYRRGGVETEVHSVDDGKK